MVSYRRKASLQDDTGFQLKKIITQGEPFIWLAGAAVSVMVFMILLILSILLFEGATSFWPRDVARLTLKDGSALAGMMSATEFDEEKNEKGETIQAISRTQYFTGNRDVSGEDFVWVDDTNVAHLDYPNDVMVFERMEWGKMIAWPVAFNLAGKRKDISADFDTGLKQIQRLLDEAATRSKKIQAIEKDAMVSVSYQLEKDHLELKKAISKGTPKKQAEIKSRIATQQKNFEKLSFQLEKLHRQDNSYRAEFKTLNGDVLEMRLSEIVRAFAPNAMNVLDKTGLYLKRLVGFLTDEPRESNTEGGVFPALFGTILMTLIMTLVVVPFGVVAALYLREYAKPGVIVSVIRIAVNNLAGVPSIVFGMFGLAFFVYRVGAAIDQAFFSAALPQASFGTGGILWASLTLALLTLPVVVVSTEEALSFVPKGIKDGSLACGASKWQTIWHVILPSAAPGILTGTILAMSRGAGEVAPLMITGVVKLAPELPLDRFFPFFHLDRKFMHLGFHIYDVGFQSPNVEAAMPMVYASAALLLIVVFVLNLTAILLRNHLRRKLKGSSF